MFIEWIFGQMNKKHIVYEKETPKNPGKVDKNCEQNSAYNMKCKNS